MNLKKRLLFSFFCFGFLAIILYGCGNVYKNLGLVSAGNQTEELNNVLDNAVTVADYIKAEALADKIIADPNASAEEKRKAHFLKGEAILGRSGLTLTDLANDLSSVDSSNSTDFIAKIKNKLNGNVTSAADELNIGKSPTNKNQELTRGLVNTIAVVSVFSDYYQINADGSLGEKTSTLNGKALVDQLATPKASGGSGLVDYTDNALGALDNASSLAPDQKAQTNTITDVGEKITSLNAALTGSSTYTYTDSGTTFTINKDSSDADVDNALSKIFN